MTSATRVPTRAGCPDPGLIAAHAERRLAGNEAARIDAHLAPCPECAEVFAETVRFVLEEEAGAGEAGVLPPSPPLPFFRRRAYQATAVLAAAAGLVLATWMVWRARAPRGQEPLVAELSRAMGDQRFVEPRLTGGFRHAPLVVLRGERAHGLDAYPPAVLSAVARIRQRAEADPSPQALGALGVTYLVSGDVGAAVKALESAAAQAPDDPRLLSDLSAAYLVRASRLDEPADIPRALEAAEKAIALGSSPDEAWFNRALALEQLHLVDAARKAWEDYVARDSSSGWAEEARHHLDALPQARQPSVEEDRARVRAALPEGPGAVDRLAAEDPSLLRDYFQDELLPAWAEAYLAGQAGARTLSGHAQLIGDALLAHTNDALARDTARELSLDPASGASRDSLREQALGFRAFREAMRFYDAQRPCCGPFREARRLLDAGGSSYAIRARERAVFACHYPGEPQAALAELRRVEREAGEHGYAHVLGLVHYLQGLVLWHRGALTTSLERYGLARAAFRAVGDTEREGVGSSVLAETFHMLGESRRAWAAREAGLALLGRTRDLRRRHGNLEEAALACLDERLLRSALDFQTAVVEAARAWSNAVAISDALVRRADIRGRLGSADAAAADLAEARRWIPRIADGPTAERSAAEADAAEGEILADREPGKAAALLSGALPYFERNSPVRVPTVRSTLARAELARGRDEEAEQQLEAGIEALESGRGSLGDAALQASFFDQAAPLFDEMVDLQLDRRRDPERALAFVERARARQLADSVLGSPERGRARAAPSTRAREQPSEPAVLRTELPEGVALVYLVSREDRLLSWALTRDDSLFEEQRVTADALRRMVAAHEAALVERASTPVLRQASARLYDALVRPLAPILQTQRAIVLVPDGVLQSVAFACLWDRQAGRYLVEDHLVGMAPSGTVFVLASRKAGAPSPDRYPSLLAIGNPRLERGLSRDIPNLPGAEAEAAEVAGLYSRSVLLTGAEATKREFLDRLRTSDVVHFAGHAVSGDSAWGAHLLFAADQGRSDSGALYLHELDGKACPRTRVVVLAACRTAAGTLSRLEGTWSLARPFLAAGVPTVVASLFDVDDVVSRGFFVAFHRALVSDANPLIALRRTQIALMRDADPSLAHPASWAGFVSVGGLDPRGLDRVPLGPASPSL